VNVAAALFLALSTPSIACSVASCDDKDGDEMRRDFRVLVTHQSSPLAGVNIWVTRFPGDDSKLFLGITRSDGTVRITGLPPGAYWLHSELLGIGAGGGCFHISSRPSRKAKKLAKYEWGDLAPSTRQIAGRMIDPSPGEGATFLRNIINHVVDPIGKARLKLQDPLTGMSYAALSDLDGKFSFGPIPNGTYVLRVEGGATPGGRDYEPADLLIRVSNTATHQLLLLERTSGGAGSCGGPSIRLDFQDTPN